MRNSIFPRLNFLRHLRRIHVSYYPRRAKTALARQLIMQITADNIKHRFPQLRVSWEMLAYDAPATLEVELLDGRRYRHIIEGYSKAEQKKIVDDWRFSASMEPWPEVLAPQPKTSQASKPASK